MDGVEQQDVASAARVRLDEHGRPSGDLPSLCPYLATIDGTLAELPARCASTAAWPSRRRSRWPSTSSAGSASSPTTWPVRPTGPPSRRARRSRQRAHRGLGSSRGRRRSSSITAGSTCACRRSCPTGSRARVFLWACWWSPSPRSSSLARPATAVRRTADGANPSARPGPTTAAVASATAPAVVGGVRGSGGHGQADREQRANHLGASRRAHPQVPNRPPPGRPTRSRAATP